MDGLCAKLKRTAFLALWLSVTALTAISCGVSDVDTKDKMTEKSQTVDECKIDTLCAYPLYSGKAGQYVFSDSAQLFSFLNATGFNMEVGGIENKLRYQPDFRKWIYFANVGGFYKSMGGILCGEDTIFITIRSFRMPTCEEQGGPPCAVTAPPEFVYVYFIPFTRKVIEFVNVIE